MLVLIMGLTVRSILSYDFGIGSIGDDDVLPLSTISEPVEVEIEPEKKQKDDSGGGGGGNEDPEPASKGRLPNMMDTPDLAPSTKMDRLTDPTLTQRVGVQGPTRTTNDSTRYGLPNGADGLSDGPGTGGGIGTGRGGGCRIGFGFRPWFWQRWRSG
jgi:hypothetical protein